MTLDFMSVSNLSKDNRPLRIVWEADLFILIPPGTQMLKAWNLLGRDPRTWVIGPFFFDWFWKDSVVELLVKEVRC